MSDLAQARERGVELRRGASVDLANVVRRPSTRAGRAWSERPTSRCCAPSWRSRSSRCRSASPAATTRARDSCSSSSWARSSACSRSCSSARRAAPRDVLGERRIREQAGAVRQERHRPAAADERRDLAVEGDGPALGVDDAVRSRAGSPPAPTGRRASGRGGRAGRLRRVNRRRRRRVARPRRACGLARSQPQTTPVARAARTNASPSQRSRCLPLVPSAPCSSASREARRDQSEIRGGRQEHGHEGQASRARRAHQPKRKERHGGERPGEADADADAVEGVVEPRRIAEEERILWALRAERRGRVEHECRRQPEHEQRIGVRNADHDQVEARQSAAGVGERGVGDERWSGGVEQEAEREPRP